MQANLGLRFELLVLGLVAYQGRIFLMTVILGYDSSNISKDLSNICINEKLNLWVIDMHIFG